MAADGMAEIKKRAALPWRFNFFRAVLRWPRLITATLTMRHYHDIDGVPVVLVLQNGRALAIPWAAEHVPAILEAWYPGEFGGRAIAETLFGDNNPAGRLTVSFPKRIGQLPVYYNHFPSKRDKYVDGDDSPQFVFGHGLSYTTFKYDHLIAAAPAPGNAG